MMMIELKIFCDNIPLLIQYLHPYSKHQLRVDKLRKYMDFTMNAIESTATPQPGDIVSNASIHSQLVPSLMDGYCAYMADYHRMFGL